MLGHEEIGALLGKADLDYGGVTDKFSETNGIPSHFWPLIRRVQSDQLVIMWLSKQFVPTPTWGPVLGVSAPPDVYWGSAVSQEGVVAVTAQVRFADSELQLVVEHGKKRICRAAPFGDDQYLVYVPGEVQRQVSRAELVYLTIDRLRISLLEAELGLDALERKILDEGG